MVNKVLQVSEIKKNKFEVNIIKKKLDPLKDSEVLIKNFYSSLNYKDVLSISGNKGITRQYPHIPGIDVAGVIIKSKDKRFKEGDEVIATGYDLGMNRAGGFAQYVVVPADWVVLKPKNLSLKRAMQFGTAGFTAMLSVMNIKNNLAYLEGKKILVTGISGGVGAISCLILSKERVHTIGATRDINSKFIKQLSLDEVIDIKSLMSEQKKPLLDREWNGSIENLGGIVLSNVMKKTDYHGEVCSCGNILGIDLNNTVYPFILRGVTLKGISSANTTMDIRIKTWQKIAEFKDWDSIDMICKEISLEQIESKAKEMLNGKNQGRNIVKIRHMG